LLLAHAQAVEPTGPADWEISEVRTSGDFSSVSMDLFGDWPGVAFNDDGTLRCAVAFDYQSGTGFSFKHTVVDAGDYLYNPHLRLMGGKPAVSYIKSLGGTKSLRFAYSIDMIPNSDTDWNNHEVTPLSNGAYSQALIEGNSAPKIVFNEDSQTVLKIAVSNVGLPSSAANWSVSDVGLGYELSYIHLILAGGQPLVSFKSEPGPASQNVYLKIADSGTPTGAKDWHSAGRIGTDTANVYDHDLAWINTGPAVCYRDNQLAALMYSASRTAVPATDGWAACTVDNGSDCGQRCRLAEYNNAPAIVYWDKDNERLRLARGI